VELLDHPLLELGLTARDCIKRDILDVTLRNPQVSFFLTEMIIIKDYMWTSGGAMPNRKIERSL